MSDRLAVALTILGDLAISLWFVRRLKLHFDDWIGL